MPAAEKSRLAFSGDDAFYIISRKRRPQKRQDGSYWPRALAAAADDYVLLWQMVSPGTLVDSLFLAMPRIQAAAVKWRLTFGYGIMTPLSWG